MKPVSQQLEDRNRRRCLLATPPCGASDRDTRPARRWLDHALQRDVFRSAHTSHPGPILAHRGECCRREGRLDEAEGLASPFRGRLPSRPVQRRPRRLLPSLPSENWIAVWLGTTGNGPAGTSPRDSKRAGQSRPWRTRLLMARSGVIQRDRPRSHRRHRRQFPAFEECPRFRAISSRKPGPCGATVASPVPWPMPSDFVHSLRSIPNNPINDQPDDNHHSQTRGFPSRNARPFRGRVEALARQSRSSPAGLAARSAGSPSQSPFRCVSSQCILDCVRAPSRRLPRRCVCIDGMGSWFSLAIIGFFLLGFITAIRGALHGIRSLRSSSPGAEDRCRLRSRSGETVRIRLTRTGQGPTEGRPALRFRALPRESLVHLRNNFHRLSYGSFVGVDGTAVSSTSCRKCFHRGNASFPGRRLVGTSPEAPVAPIGSCHPISRRAIS